MIENEKQGWVSVLKEQTRILNQCRGVNRLEVKGKQLRSMADADKFIEAKICQLSV